MQVLQTKSCIYRKTNMQVTDIWEKFLVSTHYKVSYFFRRLLFRFFFRFWPVTSVILQNIFQNFKNHIQMSKIAYAKWFVFKFRKNTVAKTCTQILRECHCTNYGNIHIYFLRTHFLYGLLKQPANSQTLKFLSLKFIILKNAVQ